MLELVLAIAVCLFLFSGRKWLEAERQSWVAAWKINQLRRRRVRWVKRNYRDLSN